MDNAQATDALMLETVGEEGKGGGARSAPTTLPSATTFGNNNGGFAAVASSSASAGPVVTGPTLVSHTPSTSATRPSGVSAPQSAPSGKHSSHHTNNNKQHAARTAHTVYSTPPVIPSPAASVYMMGLTPDADLAQNQHPSSATDGAQQSQDNAVRHSGANPPQHDTHTPRPAFNHLQSETRLSSDSPFYTDSGSRDSFHTTESSTTPLSDRAAAASQQETAVDHLFNGSPKFNGAASSQHTHKPATVRAPNHRLAPFPSQVEQPSEHKFPPHNNNQAEQPSKGMSHAPSHNATSVSATPHTDTQVQTHSAGPVYMSMPNSSGAITITNNISGNLSTNNISHAPPAATGQQADTTSQVGNQHTQHMTNDLPTPFSHANPTVPSYESAVGLIGASAHSQPPVEYPQYTVSTCLQARHQAVWKPATIVQRTGTLVTIQSDDGEFNDRDLDLSKPGHTQQLRLYSLDSTDQESINKVALKRFHTNLYSSGWKVYPVPADGNCLFHCVAHHLDDGRTYVHVRNDCCDHIQQYSEQLYSQDTLANMLNADGKSSVQEYVTAMRNPGCFGGHPELIAMANLYSLQFVIHQMNKTDYSANLPQFIEYPDYTSTIHLSLHGSCPHYDILLRTNADVDMSNGNHPESQPMDTSSPPTAPSPRGTTLTTPVALGTANPFASLPVDEGVDDVDDDDAHMQNVSEPTGRGTSQTDQSPEQAHQLPPAPPASNGTAQHTPVEQRSGKSAGASESKRQPIPKDNPKGNMVVLPTSFKKALEIISDSNNTLPGLSTYKESNHNQPRSDSGAPSLSPLAIRIVYTDNSSIHALLHALKTGAEEPNFTSKSIFQVWQILQFLTQHSFSKSVIRDASVKIRPIGSQYNKHGPRTTNAKVATFTLIDANVDTIIRSALIQHGWQFSTVQSETSWYDMPLAAGVTKQQVEAVFQELGILQDVEISFCGQYKLRFSLPKQQKQTVLHRSILALCRNQGIGVYKEIWSNHRVCGNCFSNAHTRGNCPQSSPTCGQCGAVGHANNDCTNHYKVVPCLIAGCTSKQDHHTTIHCPLYRPYHRSVLDQNRIKGNPPPRPPPKPSTTRATGQSATHITSQTEPRQTGGSSGSWAARVSGSAQQPIEIDASPQNTDTHPAPTDARSPPSSPAVPHPTLLREHDMLFTSNMGYKCASPCSDPDGYGLFANRYLGGPREDATQSGIGKTVMPRGTYLGEYSCLGGAISYSDISEVPCPPEHRYVFVNPYQKWYKNAETSGCHLKYINYPPPGVQANAAFFVTDGKRINVYTTRPIAVGEEILIDYGPKGIIYCSEPQPQSHTSVRTQQGTGAGTGTQKPRAPPAATTLSTPGNAPASSSGQAASPANQSAASRPHPSAISHDTAAPSTAATNGGLESKLDQVLASMATMTAKLEALEERLRKNDAATRDLRAVMQRMDEDNQKLRQELRTNGQLGPRATPSQSAHSNPQKRKPTAEPTGTPARTGAAAANRKKPRPPDPTIQSVAQFYSAVSDPHARSAGQLRRQQEEGEIPASPRTAPYGSPLRTPKRREQAPDTSVSQAILSSPLVQQVIAITRENRALARETTRRQLLTSGHTETQTIRTPHHPVPAAVLAPEAETDIEEDLQYDDTQSYRENQHSDGQQASESEDEQSQ
jgi:hypothetical protein